MCFMIQSHLRQSHLIWEAHYSVICDIILLGVRIVWQFIPFIYILTNIILSMIDDMQVIQGQLAEALISWYFSLCHEVSVLEQF